VKERAEYLKHAEDCRAMARAAHPAHRVRLEEMAQTWEKLAKARKRQVESGARPGMKGAVRADHRPAP